MTDRSDSTDSTARQERDAGISRRRTLRAAGIAVGAAAGFGASGAVAASSSNAVEVTYDRLVVHDAMCDIESSFVGTISLDGDDSARVDVALEAAVTINGRKRAVTVDEKTVPVDHDGAYVWLRGEQEGTVYGARIVVDGEVVTDGWEEPTSISVPGYPWAPVTAGEPVTIDAETILEPFSDCFEPRRWLWRFTHDGTTVEKAAGTEVTVSFDEPGEYTATVAVDFENGERRSETATFRVVEDDADGDGDDGDELQLH